MADSTVLPDSSWAATDLPGGNTTVKKLSIRSVSIALATLVAGVAVTVASPTAAEAKTNTGTWNKQNPTTFKIPSNWKCGPSQMAKDNRSVTQNCLVRSGNYVQVALIVRSLTTSNFATAANVSLWPHNNPYVGTVWACPPSSLAPRGLSVCFGATTYRPTGQTTNGGWKTGRFYESAFPYVESRWP